MLALTWTFLLAVTVMDLSPMVIQLVDQLEYPVLPRNPSPSDPLNVWYIKVFRRGPLKSYRFSFTNIVFVEFPVVPTRASRRPCYDH